MTLTESFASAQRRNQPYINLVNEIYTVKELFSLDSLKKYKKLDLKSLYLRVDKLVLNDFLGNKINDLTALGIKEILIFCDKTSSSLSLAEAQSFLKKYNIRINFKIVQLTIEDLTTIARDTMGKRDLLGFKEIYMDKIIYNNGHKISLLHDANSDQIILSNDLKYKKEVANQNPLSLSAPLYIKNSKNSEKETFSKNDIELEVTVDVDIEVEQTHEFEFNFELEEEIEHDKELSLDDAQMNDKYSRYSAIWEADARLKVIFSEEHLLESSPTNTYTIAEKIISKLFDSDHNIYYITGYALDLVVKYHQYFMQGIDTNNLPVGLAFHKTGIIFASDQRLTSMPIDSYTVRFDGIKSPIKEILTYSWLPYATKASFSLDDIYNKNSHLRPHGIHLKGYTKHPYSSTPKDTGLDIPLNQHNSEYDEWVDRFSGNVYPLYKTYSNLGMQKYDSNNKFTTLDTYFGYGVFPRLKFYNIAKEDIDRLNIIQNGLKDRGILDIFIKIVKGNRSTADASHLLNDKAALFIKKLFFEIFPLPIDQAKLNFFKQVLENGNYNIKRDNDVEEKFEALHALYASIKEFIKKQEIDETKTVPIFNKIAKIIVDQTKNDQNFKIMLGRLMQILDFTASISGNLDEQLAYLENNNILAEPLYYVKTKKFDLNVVHQQAFLTKNLDNEYIALTDIALTAQLDNSASTSSFFSQSSEKFPGYKMYITGIRYLSTVPPHQRASIDTYPKYLHKLDMDDRCFPRALPNQNANIARFKTSEYIVSDVLKSLEEHQSKKSSAILASKENLSTLNYLLSKEPQIKSKDQCYAELSVIGKNSDLVKHFTNKQATENVRLLLLNMASSAGKYYNKQYPDQEFDSYISLFNVLFTNVKIYTSQKIGENHYKADQSYITKYVYISESTALDPVSSYINEQETNHKKMINQFVNISKNNPEFNFAQIVALGLVSIFENSILGQTIESAKILLQYDDHLTQVFRILLSTAYSTNKKSDFEELGYRAKAIANTINTLAKMHKFVTQNGKHPENIQFFAACFDSSKVIVNEEMVRDLQIKLSRMDIALKQALLDSFANSKLAYDNGKIVDNSFPSISLKLLDNPEKLKQIITQSKAFTVTYPTETRFNIIGLDSKMNAKIDLTLLEKKYKLALPDKLKHLNYKRIVTKVDDNENFIKVELLNNSNDKKVIQNLSIDLLQLLFESIADRTPNYKNEVTKIIELLFDKEQSLAKQIRRIHTNKQLIDKLLKLCANHHERTILLDLLSDKPAIPYDNLYPILVYLNSIDIIQLKAKGYDFNKLLKAAGNELIIEHFKEFKAITNAFLKHNLKIDLKHLYQAVQKISAANYDNHNLAKIISYCLNNQDFYIADILSKLDGKADNINKLISWITALELTSLKKISSYADVDKLLAIKDLRKIQVITNIILHFQDELTKTKYNQLVKQIAKNDIHYAYLLRSYLFSPQNAELTESLKKRMIFENLNSLENVQKIFSEHNLDRFNYDEAHVISKIRAVVYKNLNKAIAQEKQNELFQYFERIISLSKHYSTYTNTQIYEEALELKHKRMLAKVVLDKDDTDYNRQLQLLDEIRDTDLDYIGLSLETMYRETGLFPRDIQVISLLITITHDKNLIHEVATGQGKSLITALHAAYLAYTGQTVDVATSSEYLAQQAIKEFASFYRNLGIAYSEEVITPSSEISIYKKYGVNIGVASSLALFEANRDFHSNTLDLGFNADKSLICDEVDHIMTSEVNYKLAVPLIKTTQEETRVLFNYIIQFSKEAKLLDIKSFGRDGAKNLILYLNHQFNKYNLIYQYPLNALQLYELKNSKNKVARDLYDLHIALTKCDKNIENIFDTLLNGVKAAEKLELGVDYVVNFNDKSGPLRAVPIIKDQPSQETVFGDGAQTFLHLLIEQQLPQYKSKFDTSPPTSTIFNISPKVFFDSYLITGGRVIGLTGTAGNAIELEEFRTTNKMLAFSIPMYEEDKKIVKTEIVANADAQYKRLLEILAKKTADRPVIIFTQSTKDAEQLYFKLQKQLNINNNLKLYAASQHDSDTIVKTVQEASNKGRVLVTAPLLSRGTDFIIKNSKEGFLAIGLNDKIHLRGFMQQYGRVGRNGNPGEYIAIFNKEVVGQNIDLHMEKISQQEKTLRTESQPYTDILQAFNVINRDQEANAIITIDTIKKIWKKLQKENNGQKSPAELGKDLLKAVKNKYPTASKQIDDYLARISRNIPKKEAVHKLTLRTSYDAPYITQDYSETKFIIQDDKSKSWPTINRLARSAANIDISDVDYNDPDRKAFYNKFFQARNIIMSAHVFNLQEPKSGFALYEYKPKQKPSTGIIDTLMSSIYSNDQNDKASFSIKGEGSAGNLMMSEFKKSFKAYQNAVMSPEVDQIANLIENFVSAENIDLTKLQPGKYQAIKITTLFTSEASHAESIMTDGKFLFWVNRGGGAEDNQSGIKIFKIIKNINTVKQVLTDLKQAKSRTDTLEKIYSLLREKTDTYEPKHVLISMSPQSTGNCGWVQVKGMLKVAALVGKIGNLDALPDVTSQEWQKALKDSDEIYKDFTTYDRITRAEAILLSVDPTFVPQFLNFAEQTEILERREKFDQHVSYQLLENLAHALDSTPARYERNKYEHAYHKILDALLLEVAVDSPFGKALQAIAERDSVKSLLNSYQQNRANNFEQLDKVYSSLDKSSHQEHGFKIVLDYIVEEEYIIYNLDSFVNQVESFDRSCARVEYQECMKSHLSGLSSTDGQELS